MRDFDLVIRIRDQTSRALRGIRNALSSFQTKSLAIAASITAAFAGIFSGKLFASGVDSARAFEKQLDVVRSVLTGSPESIDAAMLKVEDAAKEMGSTTAFTATQAAEALEELIRAGLGAEDALVALPTVLNAASGAGITLADSAARLTDVSAVLGLGVNDLERIADVLGLTASTSATNFEQLSDALVRSGAVVRQSGLSIERASAILGIFANNGLRSAEAGTALLKLLNEINNPLSKFQKELAKSGIEVNTLEEAIAFLSEGTPVAQRAIFRLTAEARDAANKLIVATIPAVDRYTETINNAAGASKSAADIMADNLSGALDGLGSAWEAVQIAVFNQNFLDLIKKSVDDAATALRNAVADGTLDNFRAALIEAFQSAQRAVATFVTEFNLNVVLKDIGDFVKGSVDTLSGFIQQITVVTQSIRIFVNGFTLGVKIIGLLAVELVRTIGGLFDPVFALLNTIGVLPDSALNSFRTGIDAYKAISAEFVESIKEDSNDIADAWGKITGTVSGATDQTVQFLDAHVKAAGQAAIAITEAVAGALSEINNVDAGNLQQRAQQAKENFDFIAQSGAGSAETIQDAYIKYATLALSAAQALGVAEGVVAEERLRTEAATLNEAAAFEEVVKQLDNFIVSGDKSAESIQKGVDESKRLKAELIALTEAGASIDEIAEKQRQYTESIKTSEDAINEAVRASEERDKQQKAALEEIIGLRRQLADEQTSTEEQLREIRRRNLTDEQKQRDIALEASELRRKATQALLKAQQATNEETRKQAIDDAKAAADRSQSLGNRIKDQATALSIVRDAGKIQADIIKEEIRAREEAGRVTEKSAQSQADSLKETVIPLVQQLEFAEKTTQTMRELGAASESVKAPEIDVQVESEQAFSIFDRIQSTLNDLAKGVTIPIRTSGNIPNPQGFSTGGRIGSGFGGGDRIHILAEEGEFIINKFAARMLGDKRLQQLNSIGKTGISTDSLFSRGIQVLQNGGSVSNTSARKVVDINFNINNKKFELFADEGQASGLSKELSLLSRSQL